MMFHRDVTVRFKCGVAEGNGQIVTSEKTRNDHHGGKGQSNHQLPECDLYDKRTLVMIGFTARNKGFEQWTHQGLPKAYGIV
jgi:hypothetical protein